MAIANENFPGSGEMSAVEAFASGSRVRASELRGLRDALSGAASDAVEGASSAAVVAWKLRMIPLKSTLNSIIGELESRASAADTYVSAVEDIRLRAQQRQSDKRDLAASLHYWHCAPYEYQQSFDGQSRLSQIYAGQRAVASALQALLSERHEADRTFTAALSDAPAVKGLSFAQLSGIGSTVSATPNLVSVRRAVNVAQAQSVTRQVLENPGDEDALLAWQRELDDLGDDQAAWNMFYAENGGITGEELALSLAAFSTVWRAGNVGVGSRAADAVVASSQRLRQGLAIASATWTQPRASGFASSMFSAVRSGSASPSTVAFLFQNQRTALQGQALTVAVAEELDQLERVEGQWTSRVYDLSQEQSLLVMAGVTPGEGWEHLQEVDITTQVLASLSHYPEGALQWLATTGEPANHTRIEYWFGMRPWGDYGYEAPAMLVAAMQEVPHGIASLDSDLTHLTAEQHSTIAAQTDVLGQVYLQIASGGPYGEGWSRAHVSEEVSEIIAETVNRHHLQLAASTIATVSGAGITSGGNVELFGNPDLLLPHIEVTRETLGGVMSRLSTSVATETLNTIGVSFSGTMGRLVDTGQVNPETAFVYTYEIAAFADGTLDGLSILDGREVDAQTVKNLAFWENLTGATIDALGYTPATAAVSAGASLWHDYLFDLAYDGLLTAEDEAVENAETAARENAVARADASELADLYSDDFRRWLGTEYFNPDGTPDVERIDGHLRGEAAVAAGAYWVDRDDWRRDVSGQDDEDDDRGTAPS